MKGQDLINDNVYVSFQLVILFRALFPRELVAEVVHGGLFNDQNPERVDHIVRVKNNFYSENAKLLFFQIVIVPSRNVVQRSS